MTRGASQGRYESAWPQLDAGRPGDDIAVSSKSVDEIRRLSGIFKTPNGNIYWTDPSIINTDARAVGADNLASAAGFSGQIFVNPTAGEVGSLPIFAFGAPPVWQLDSAPSKRFTFARRCTTEFRIDACNVFHLVSFYSGDMNITSTTFGRITGVGVGARVAQLTARFTFQSAANSCQECRRASTGSRSRFGIRDSRFSFSDNGWPPA